MRGRVSIKIQFLHGAAMDIGNLESASIRFRLNQRRWIQILDEIAFTEGLSLSVHCLHMDLFLRKNLSMKLKR